MRGHGVGLAAPQIGQSIRLIVMEDTDDAIRRAGLNQAQIEECQRSPFNRQVIFNPTLRPIGTSSRTFFEGCLSVEGARLTGLVERYLNVEVTGLDELGETKSWKMSGWPARIVQHEIDHLDRILFTDPCRLVPKSCLELAEARDRFQGKLIAQVIAELGLESSEPGRADGGC
jgi:peptide deformylase